MQYIQELELDVSCENVYRFVNAKQGDSATRFIKATIVADGVKLALDSTMSANLRCLKPDGRSVYNPAVINDDGTVLTELTQQALAMPGLVKADIEITGSDGGIISTVTFIIQVSAAPLGNNVASSNEFLTLNALIAKCEKVLSGSGGSIAATGDGDAVVITTSLSVRAEGDAIVLGG